MSIDCHPIEIHITSDVIAVTSVFMLAYEGEGVLNTLINKLPFKAHLLGGYQYCGPGTRLQERLTRGDPGINPLDAACKHHDIAHSQSESPKDRHKADEVLEDRAWERIKAGDSGFGVCANALLVTGAMKTERNLERAVYCPSCGGQYIWDNAICNRCVFESS